MCVFMLLNWFLLRWFDIEMNTEKEKDFTLNPGLVANECLNLFVPFLFQLHYYRYLWKKSKAYKTFSDKVSTFLKGPSWKPGKPRLGDHVDNPKVCIPSLPPKRAAAFLPGEPVYSRSFTRKCHMKTEQQSLCWDITTSRAFVSSSGGRLWDWNRTPLSVNVRAEPSRLQRCGLLWNCHTFSPPAKKRRNALVTKARAPCQQGDSAGGKQKSESLGFFFLISAAEEGLKKVRAFWQSCRFQMRCGGNPNVLNRVPGSTHVPTFAYRCPRGGPKEATFSLSRHKVSHSILTEGLIYSRVFGGNRSTP